MKTILTLFLFGLIFSLHAADISFKAIKQYTIVSDNYTNDLLSGEVRVKGVVTDQNGAVIAGALVSTIDDRVSTTTDSTGAYEIIIHDSDTAIYMYKLDFNEVAMDSYDFRAGHTVQVNFTPSLSSIIPVGIEENYYPVSYKPVIYMYATTSLQVSLALDYLGDLTFTYPQYNEGWNVNLDANGIHTLDHSQSFPYLFWEGEMTDLTYQEQDGELLGQFIATDTLVAFLESQLSAIGLNRTEQTDFITFWAPRMLDKEYVFIQFLLDDLYTSKIASLTVSPTPDSQKRVYLLYTNFDEIPNITSSPQVFTPFQRNGFTLLEWGGSNLKQLKAI